MTTAIAAFRPRTNPFRLLALARELLGTLWASEVAKVDAVITSIMEPFHAKVEL